MIAAVLTGAAAIDRPQPLDIEDVLVAMRDLSPSSLVLLRQIHEMAAGQPVGSIMTAVVPTTVPDRDFLLNRLVAAGFIQEMKINEYSPHVHYQPTDTFLRVVQLMQAGGWRSDSSKDP